MGQLLVQHYRGLKEHYNKASHGQGIYFATDTKEIILNGESYSGEGSESFAALQTQVQQNTDALVVLNGTGEGSVAKIVNDAINDFANKVSDNGTIDSFKEVVDYIAEHGGDFNELVLEVSAIKEKDVEQDARIDALELLIGGGDGTEGESIVETVSGHTEAITQLQTDVDAVEETSAINASDIESLQTLVGNTPVSEQISDALSWEDVV